MDLSNNLITQIPEPILQFLDLQVIRLRSNQIEALPPFLK
jgi:Leucine-rich repeat (LRR) protein